jgi:hypothetical protein
MRSRWLLLFLCPVLLWPQGRGAAPAASPPSNRDRQLDQDQRSAQTHQKSEEQQRAAVESLKTLQGDTEQLRKLAQALQESLAAGNPDVLSEESLKRNDEMEKLVKKIRTTMKKAAGR